MKPKWNSIAVLTAAVMVLAATLIASGLPSQNPAVATVDIQTPVHVILVGCATSTENGNLILGDANFFEFPENNSNGAYDELTCAEGLAATAAHVAEKDCKFIAALNQLWKYCVFTPVGDRMDER